MKSFLPPLGIGKVTETSLKRSLRGALVALDVEVQVSLLSWKGPKLPKKQHWDLSSYQRNQEMHHMVRSFGGCLGTKKPLLEIWDEFSIGVVSCFYLMLLASRIFLCKPTF